MSSLCLAAGAMAVSLSWQAFTLIWTHSVEKIEWQEDYSIDGKYLQLTAARVKGTGAGMEIPPRSIFAGGMYHYWPGVPALDKLLLGRSKQVKDYTICWELGCMPLSDLIPRDENDTPVEVFACAARGARRAASPYPTSERTKP